MAKRKLTETEKTQKLLKRFKEMLNDIIGLCERDLKAAKEDPKLKLEAGKLQQLTTTAGILIDKIEKLTKQIQETPPEDLTLKFEEETARKMYEFVEKNDTFYHNYLLLIKAHPELLKKVLKLSDKEIEILKSKVRDGERTTPEKREH